MQQIFHLTYVPVRPALAVLVDSEGRDVLVDQQGQLEGVPAHLEVDRFRDGGWCGDQWERRRVRLDEIPAQLGDTLQQRLRMGVVGAEERRVLTVLLDPCGHFFEDELLRARHPHVARRVRRRLGCEADAQVPARGLHDGTAPAQRINDLKLDVGVNKINTIKKGK